MRGRAWTTSVAAILLAFAAGACFGDGLASGTGEPIVVESGSFQPGALPGTPPLDDAQIDAGAMPTGTYVTELNSPNRVLFPGQAGRALSGLATGDSSSVGLRFGDLGTGFWVVTLGAEDPANPGQLGWSLLYDVARVIPAGLHPLLVTAIDAAGNSGTQQELVVCVDAPIPDNLNACDPTLEPPFMVLSLDWDANVDLELVLVTPDGKVVDPQHPTTAPETDAGVMPGPDDGVLDHASNEDCVIDGVRRDDIVWQHKPEPGTYLVYARLASACGLPATRFTASLWFATPTGPSTWTQTEALAVSGEALADSASGDQGLGTYLTDFSIH
jgi:hypothetical protein